MEVDRNGLRRIAPIQLPDDLQDPGCVGGEHVVIRQLGPEDQERVRQCAEIRKQAAGLRDAATKALHEAGARRIAEGNPSVLKEARVHQAGDMVQATATWKMMHHFHPPGGAATSHPSGKIPIHVVSMLSDGSFWSAPAAEKAKRLVVAAGLDVGSVVTSVCVEFLQQKLQGICEWAGITEGSLAMTLLNEITGFTCAHPILASSALGAVFGLIISALIDWVRKKPIDWTNHSIMATLTAVMSSLLAPLTASIAECILAVVVVAAVSSHLRRELEIARAAKIGFLSGLWDAICNVPAVMREFFDPVRAVQPYNVPPDHDVPLELCCPITHCLIGDAARLGNNFYERSAIVQWVTQHEKDPFLQCPATVDDIKRCGEMSRLTSRYAQLHGFVSTA
jgi:hypothetical protein